MLLHYLRLAVRVIRKQRLLSALNVLGLSVALGLAATIGLIVQDEYSYDDWHEHKDRIYRVDEVEFLESGEFDEQQSAHSYAFGPTLEADVAGIEHTIRFLEDDVVTRFEGSMHTLEVMFADAAVFDVFSYEVIDGSLAGALTDPASVVLTRSAATRRRPRVL